jgi:hypothetical protein
LRHLLYNVESGTVGLAVGTAIWCSHVITTFHVKYVFYLRDSCSLECSIRKFYKKYVYREGEEMKPTNLELLEAYKSIWNHRSLNQEGTEPGDVLKEAVLRELLDENSHPRIRKNKEEKYYFAVKRILEASLSADAKLQLIQLHTSLLNDLRNT